MNTHHYHHHQNTPAAFASHNCPPGPCAAAASAPAAPCTFGSRTAQTEQVMATPLTSMMTCGGRRGREGELAVAVGETLVRLHPPPSLVGESIGEERGVSANWQNSRGRKGAVQCAARGRLLRRCLLRRCLLRRCLLRRCLSTATHRLPPPPFIVVLLIRGRASPGSSRRRGPGRSRAAGSGKGGWRRALVGGTTRGD